MFALCIKTASDDLNFIDMTIDMIYVHWNHCSLSLRAAFQPFLESSFEQVYGLCDVSCWQNMPQAITSCINIVVLMCWSLNDSEVQLKC